MAQEYGPGCGIDRYTGQVISDWDHVRQSLEVIFTTNFGERVMREYFGSAVPRLLGENMVPATFVRYFSAVCGAVAIWEPRYSITKILPVSVDRAGRAKFYIEGEYRPRGHLGDMTPFGMRRVSAAGAPGLQWTIGQ